METRATRRPWTEQSPCPACGGHARLPRGQGIRCHGFAREGLFYCAREEASPNCRQTQVGLYRHQATGPCWCGVTHQPGQDALSRNGKTPGHRQAATTTTSGPRTIVAAYDYRDQDGQLLFQVVRYSNKDFLQRRPDGKGDWIWNLAGVEKVLYRLPELIDADPDATVFIAEGEKDVDRLRELGLVATCNPGGSGQWEDRFAEHLHGRDVVVLRDNDEKGRKHVLGPCTAPYMPVLPSVQGKARRVRFVELPGLAERGDVSDFLLSHSKDDLLALVAAAPEWTSPPEPADDVATLADVRRALGETTHTWKGWIQPGTVTSLAADAGTGKTVTALAFCRIVWTGDPWPDQSFNTLPAGRPSLWLCYDRAWRGILRAAEKLGLPDEAIILPTSTGKPLWVPDLDDPSTIPLLERIIRRQKPWAVILDSMTYATGNNVALAHEAKLAYSPLMGVMAETGCCCLSLTHLSTAGKVLNRRPVELCRTVIKLVAPDPANPVRLRMWVDKSDDERPPALGVTIGGDDLVTFDDAPPELDGRPAQTPGRGRPASKSPNFAEWLFHYLDIGPALMVDLIEAARDAGLLRKPDHQNPDPSISPLYNARSRIPRVYHGWMIEDFKQVTPRGKELQTWQKVKREDHRDNPEATDQ